jgi:hypothetical protein
VEGVKPPSTTPNPILGNALDIRPMPGANKPPLKLPGAEIDSYNETTRR